MPGDSKTDGSDSDQIEATDHNTSRMSKVRADPVCRKMSRAADSKSEVSDARSDESNSSSSEDDDAPIYVRKDPDSLEQQITPMLNKLSIAPDSSPNNVESELSKSEARELRTRTISESSDASTSEQETNDDDAWTEEKRRMHREEIKKIFAGGNEDADYTSDEDSNDENNNGDDEDDEPNVVRTRGRVRSEKQFDHDVKPYSCPTQRSQRTVDVTGAQTLGNNYLYNQTQYNHHGEFSFDNYDEETLIIDNNIFDGEGQSLLWDFSSNTLPPDILSQDQQWIVQPSNGTGHVISPSTTPANGSPTQLLEAQNILSHNFVTNTCPRPDIFLNGCRIESPEHQMVPTNEFDINYSSPSHHMFSNGSPIQSPKARTAEAGQLNTQYSPQPNTFRDGSLSQSPETLSAQTSRFVTENSPQSSMCGDSSPVQSPQTQIVPSPVFANNYPPSSTSFIDESSSQLHEVNFSHTDSQQLLSKLSRQLSFTSEFGLFNPTGISDSLNLTLADGIGGVDTPPQLTSDSSEQQYHFSIPNYQQYASGTETNQMPAMEGISQTNNVTDLVRLLSNIPTSDNNNFDFCNAPELMAHSEMLLPNTTAPMSVFGNVCQTSNTTQLHSPTTQLQLSRKETERKQQPSSTTSWHKSSGGNVTVNRNDQGGQNILESFGDHITKQKNELQNYRSKTRISAQSKKPLTHAVSNAHSTKTDNFSLPEPVKVFNKKSLMKTNVTVRPVDFWSSLNLPNVAASERLKKEVPKDDSLRAQIRLFTYQTEYFEAKDESGNTCLMALVRDPRLLSGDIAYLGPVLSKMENVPHSLITKNNDGHDALYLAANNCPNLHYVSGVIAAKIFDLHGANSEFWTRTYGNGNTLIHVLAAEGDMYLPVILELLAVQESKNHRIFDLSAKNDDGLTPRHLAVAAAGNGRKTADTVSLLMKHDADPIIPDSKNGDTPLYAAISHLRDTSFVIST